MTARISTLRARSPTNARPRELADLLMSTISPGQNWLVRVNARPDTVYVSHGRTVLAARRDGFIGAEPGHGLFVHETRLISTYRLLIDGEPPTPNVLSNVEQHSWLGY